jgi:large subunit ribosomal protein L24
MAYCCKNGKNCGVKMEKKFVKTWSKSVQPRKQRKYRHNAPLHLINKFLSVNLSKELRQKNKKRSITIRKGDKIKVMRGQYKSQTGTVERVSVKFQKVYVTGIDQVRKDGTKRLIPFEPSNLQIVQLDTSDKKRLKVEE